MHPVYHRSFANGLEGKYEKIMTKLTPGMSVLEIGCHTGYFARYLIDRGYKVLGVEKDADAAADARNEGVSVICADISDPEILNTITQRFDVILLMDVIEHLEHPESTLRQLKSLLTRTGRLLITGPNVAYWAVRMHLLAGRWNYQETGILDRTHLHFYTALTWKRLLNSSDYDVTDLEPAESMIPFERLLIKLISGNRLVEKLRRFAASVKPELFTVVYFLEAIPR